MISISVVSHGQLRLIHSLFEDIKKHCTGYPFEVILTLNFHEEFPFEIDEYPFVVKVMMNPAPKGFGANHNAAFLQAKGEFFCVINPDIRLKSDPFQLLKQSLLEQRVGVVAPLIQNEQGTIEDSARRFPTPFGLLRKAIGKNKQLDYEIGRQLLFPDWVGGMFMLFNTSTYKEIGGFDEGFFLYYEDVDLCARLSLQGYSVILNPEIQVVHEAQRSSHHDFKYLKWHLLSISRFFCSAVFLKLQWRRFV